MITFYKMKYLQYINLQAFTRKLNIKKFFELNKENFNGQKIVVQSINTVVYEMLQYSTLRIKGINFWMYLRLWWRMTSKVSKLMINLSLLGT